MIDIDFLPDTGYRYLACNIGLDLDVDFCQIRLLYNYSWLQ